MEILVKTIAERTNYTISKMYIDGVYCCDVLEDTVRDLSKCHKIKGITAIPKGRYKVRMDIQSPRFGGQAFYKQYANGGRLPRLCDVPQFEGVLIHCGNNDKDTEGCLLVGENKAVGKVLNSKETFKRVYKILQSAKDEIWITIQRKSY